MKREFTLTCEIQATPERIFKAWMSSEGHTAMTGSGAKVEPRVGGAFSAWDGYITGKTVALRPYSRIEQSWRTGEFAESDPDSRLEITLEAKGASTKLTLRHSEIPEGQAESYETGWREWYFGPMQSYFAQQP